MAPSSDRGGGRLSDGQQLATFVAAFQEVEVGQVATKTPKTPLHQEVAPAVEVEPLERRLEAAPPRMASNRPASELAICYTVSDS